MRTHFHDHIRDNKPDHVVGGVGDSTDLHREDSAVRVRVDRAVEKRDSVVGGTTGCRAVHGLGRGEWVGRRGAGRARCRGRSRDNSERRLDGRGARQARKAGRANGPAGLDTPFSWVWADGAGVWRASRSSWF